MITIDKSKIRELAETHYPDVVADRRYLHRHPEPSFQEFNTSEFITKQLDKLGIPYTKGIVKTGIVALIKGKNPEKNTFALRGDMDALPIVELNEVEYKSVNEGYMHACGHDVHTACLLGAARILNELKNDFEGTAKLIFQPGEEVLPGGAALMIEEGVLENPKPSGIVGEHVYPKLDAGKVGFRPGKYMASADEIHMTITGKGGHAAEPHLLIDPVVIAAHTITALQDIASRFAPVNVPTVLSIGYVSAQGATNVIPDMVDLKGTFRTMDETWRRKAHQLIKDIAEGTAAKYGGHADVNVIVGYPVLENDEQLTVRSREYAIELLGPENVVDLELRMGGEDFAFYTHHVPGCFYRLGISKPGSPSSGLHTPTFDIDENALKTGMALLSWITLRELNRKK